MKLDDIAEFVNKAAAAGHKIEQITVSSSLFFALTCEIPYNCQYQGDKNLGIVFHTQNGSVTIKSSILEEIANLEYSIKKNTERNRDLEKELEELKKLV